MLINVSIFRVSVGLPTERRCGGAGGSAVGAGVEHDVVEGEGCPEVNHHPWVSRAVQGGLVAHVIRGIGPHDAAGRRVEMSRRNT